MCVSVCVCVLDIEDDRCDALHAEIEQSQSFILGWRYQIYSGQYTHPKHHQYIIIIIITPFYL